MHLNVEIAESNYGGQIFITCPGLCQKKAKERFNDLLGAKFKKLIGWKTWEGYF